VLHNANVIGNIVKWAVEPAEFELDFIPRHAVKGQVLVDFVANWMPPPCHPRPPWTLFFDGSSRKSGAGAGIVLLIPDGEQFKYMVHLNFKATNNMAEYDALIFGLSTALSLGVRQLLVKGDSQLIIKQVKGECCCNEPQLATYLLHA
jgi:hypothetical protein